MNKLFRIPSPLPTYIQPAVDLPFPAFGFPRFHLGDRLKEATIWLYDAAKKLKEPLVATAQVVLAWEVIDCAFMFFLFKLSIPVQYTISLLPICLLGAICLQSESFLTSAQGERYRNVADNIFWLYFYYFTYMCSHILVLPMFLMIRKHMHLKDLFYKAFTGAFVWSACDFLAKPFFVGQPWFYHKIFGTVLFFFICLWSYYKTQKDRKALDEEG